MAVETREARPDDAPEIARLLGQLGYPTDGDTVTRRLERLGGDLLLVAESEGAVAGLAQLHVSPSLEYDRPGARLAALVVDEARRGSGVGRALVDAVEAVARTRDCEILFVTTAEHRGDAHAFYERLGMAHTGRRYGKRLA